MDKFLEILQKIFSFIYNNILQPVLDMYLKALFTYWGTYLKLFFGHIFFLIFLVLLKIVDFMERCFGIFCGSETIYYNEQPTTFTDWLFGQSFVGRGLGIMLIIGTGMAFGATVISVWRSMTDNVFVEKKPVGHVLGQAFRTAVTFLLIPLLCTFMLRFSAIVLDGTEMALSQGTNTTMGTLIFLSATMNAAIDKKYNVDYYEEHKSDPGLEVPSFSDKYRNEIFTGEKSYADDFRTEFNFSDMGPTKWVYGDVDYIPGYTVCIITFVILFCTILVFIRRVMELLVLYIVSPLFAATIPLDDGERFKKWKDMFIAKFFAGFGPVFAMRVYMVLMPTIFGGGLRFADHTLKDVVLKILFMIGGCYAIFKSQAMIMTILNDEAGQQEQGTIDAAFGALTTAAKIAKQAAETAAAVYTGGASMAATQAFNTVTSMASQAISGMASAAGSGESSGNKF